MPCGHSEPCLTEPAGETLSSKVRLMRSPAAFLCRKCGRILSAPTDNRALRFLRKGSYQLPAVAEQSSYGGRSKPLPYGCCSIFVPMPRSYFTTAADTIRPYRRTGLPQTSRRNPKFLIPRSRFRLYWSFLSGCACRLRVLPHPYASRSDADRKISFRSRSYRNSCGRRHGGRIFYR